MYLPQQLGKTSGEFTSFVKLIRSQVRVKDRVTVHGTHHSVLKEIFLNYFVGVGSGEKGGESKCTKRQNFFKQNSAGEELKAVY